DAHSKPSGGWHAVLEGPNVVLVVVHGFVSAATLAIDLVEKAVSLIVRVVQLAKGVTDLATVDEQFEAVDIVWIRVFSPSQRRHGRRMIHDEDGNALIARFRAIVLGKKRLGEILVGDEVSISSC